jgi:hypothetical protein
MYRNWRFGICRGRGLISLPLQIFAFLNWLLLFFNFLLFPVRIKYIFKQLGHGLLKRVIVRIGGIDEVVDHLHNDIIVNSRLSIFVIIRIVREVIILYGISVILLIGADEMF